MRKNIANIIPSIGIARMKKSNKQQSERNCSRSSMNEHCMDPDRLNLFHFICFVLDSLKLLSPNVCRNILSHCFSCMNKLYRRIGFNTIDHDI